MAAGYLFNDQCYGALADATHAYHASVPAGLLPGTTSYILQKEWSGSAWVVKRFTLASDGTMTLNSTTSLPSLSFPTCDTTSHFFDGLAVGWGLPVRFSWPLLLWPCVEVCRDCH